MPRVFFDLTYSGLDLLQVVRNRAHPMYAERSRIGHNLYWDEIEAAERWGLVPDENGYFALDRKARALMTARVMYQKIVDAMGAWDASHK